MVPATLLAPLLSVFPVLAMPVLQGPDAGAETPEAEVTQVVPGGGAIPVQVVAGKLVVACDLSTPANRIPVNLFIEFEGAHGLQLHNRAAAGLRAETSDGKAIPITMHFPEFSVTVPKRELGDEDLFEEYTKYNSIEIGENALVGSIGVEVWQDWIVEFSLAQGEVRLSPPQAATEAPPSSVSVQADGTIVAPITLINDRVWLPVRRPDGSPGAMMLGTGVYDTIVDRDWAEGLRKPGGDVGPVKVGSLDVHSFVALRPEPLAEVHPDGVVGQIGLNLLESVDIRVDRARRVATLKPSRPAEFPETDREYFIARAEEESARVIAYLEKNGDSRLAHEASKTLLNLLIDERAGEEDLGRAVQWLADTTKEDLRTTRMLDLMKEMADAGQSSVVLAAGKLGVDSGRDDRYPNAVHNVHGILGRTYLNRFESTGEGSKDAWRHLLSAAFGLPEDGNINLDLGRFYETQKRYNRAFSRYIQAVIQPDSGAQALEALQRVQPLLDAESAFSVDTIERMIAGKVRNFGAATRFEPSEKEPSNKTVLVEFFTNCHQGDERGGAIGGALGNEGLIQHFGPEHVVFLSHHLPNPMPDPLCTSFAQARAEQVGIDQPGVHVIDGRDRQPGAARWRQAEGVYQRVRGSVMSRLKKFSDHELAIETRMENVDGEWHLRGTVKGYGFEDEGLMLQVVLAEKGVLAPGRSTVVVHRAVARGVLTESNDGVDFEITDEEDECMTHSIDQALTGITDANKAFLDKLESGGGGSTVRISENIDPRQVHVVAFLYYDDTGEILCVSQAQPELPKELQ